MRSPGVCGSTLALCLGAPLAAHAQGVQSAARSITMLAVKRPAVEALDVVRVTTESSSRTESGDGLAVRVDVSVRGDGPCEIRIRRRSGDGAPILVVDVTGAERELLVGAALILFRGDCRESAPDHPVALRVPDVAVATPSAHDVGVVYEVTGLAGGQTRRWFVVDAVRLQP